MALMGLDERVSAQRAHQVGLVSEVVPPDRLRERGQEIARKIAAKSPAAIQATVRVAWDSIGKHPTQTNDMNMHYSALVKLMPAEAEVQLETAGKQAWELR